MGADELRGGPLDPYIGTVLADRYRVLGLLGEGGMSRVYVGQHVVIERRVAIKVLLPALATDQMFVHRFLDEGRAAGTIGHPNIASSLDMGYAPNGSPFLVFELLDGSNLSHEIARVGGLEVGRAAYIGVQIAAALQAAHARDIVHRDLKPENIFLTRERLRPDHVKVVDFGISKFTRRDHVDRQTQAGVLLGTPDYMAPEQVLDMANVDARADVYALGAILYTALAGRPPFDGHPFPHILHVVVSEPPPRLDVLRPDVPAGLVAVIARAMEKDRDLRFASMSELGHALEPFAVEPPVTREQALRAQDVRSDPAPRRSASARPELDPAPSPELGRGAASETPQVERASARAITANPSVPAREQLAPTPKANAASTLARRAAPWLLALLFGSGAVAWRFAHPATASRSSDRARASVVGSVEAMPSGESAARAQSAATASVDIYVTSDSPTARATLRGATHDLPYHASLLPSQVPEPVEVTAPGFQGRRFSVSMAASRNLVVHLTRGSGTRDATSSETELALGASRAPATAAWAHSPAIAPHAAAGKSLAAATQREEDNAPLEPPSPSPAAPRPPAAPPSPLPVQRPKEVAAVLPVPAETNVAVPNIAPGTIDRKAASAVIRTHSGELQTCLVRARMDNPDSGGRIALVATVAPNGAVSAVSITASNANSARLEQCVLAAFRSWTLPAPSGGVSGSLLYAFNLK